MSIVRGPRPQSHFTQLRNESLRDPRMSLRATGLLARILSYPEDWRITSAALASQCKEGREAIRAALRELREFGYLEVRRYQNEKGHWVQETVVHEQPTVQRQEHDGRLRPEDLDY